MKEYLGMDIFLDREFEFGGTIGKLAPDKGAYKGVYIIVLPKSFQEVCFNERSNAGSLEDKDPTIAVDISKKKWVDEAEILYIGKHETSVKNRMRQHFDFWNGKAVPAWGGRIIAQIRNFENLEVWYLSCDNPQDMERTLLKEFETQYKKLPFANWRH